MAGGPCFLTYFGQNGCFSDKSRTVSFKAAFAIVQGVEYRAVVGGKTLQAQLQGDTTEVLGPVLT